MTIWHEKENVKTWGEMIGTRGPWAKRKPFL